MTDTYNRAVSLILVMLKGETNPNSETIQKKVDLVLGMLKAEGDSDPVNRDRLIKDIESRCEIWRGSATVLENKKTIKFGYLIKKSNPVEILEEIRTLSNGGEGLLRTKYYYT